VVPVVIESPGTVVAVNIGGAVIPTLLLLYLLFKEPPVDPRNRDDRSRGSYRPHAGLPRAGRRIDFCTTGGDRHCGGTDCPRARPPCSPMWVGSLGTLIGADLLNLGVVRGVGTPVTSIGGAGTFDGIFLTASWRCCW
jgi:hypothetical protein